ncbi:MAG: hypothetical protein PVJ49_17335 [Acidobacteriota bacterium]|jgi:hypothetical protein
MSASSQRIAECPSWTRLARFVEEGGPWPVEHLRGCDACRRRRWLLEGLSALGDTGQGAAVGREGCPGLIEFVALVDGNIDQFERIRLADHLVACESCAGLLRELVAFSVDDGADWEVRENTEAVVPETARHGPRFGSGLRRIAALVLVAAASAIVYLMPFPAIESGAGGRWRGPAPRLEATITWAPREAGPELTWDEWPGASSYRLRVWNEGGQRLLERHIAAGQTRRLSVSLTVVVDQSRAALREGDLLFWQLDALDAGEVAASSGPTELRWEPR